MLQRARRAAWFTNNAELVAFAAWNAFFMYLSYEFYTCVYRSCYKSHIRLIYIMIVPETLINLMRCKS